MDRHLAIRRTAFDTHDTLCVDHDVARAATELDGAQLEPAERWRTDGRRPWSAHRRQRGTRPRPRS